MNLKRVGVLLAKELVQGPKSFMFIWMVAMPVIMSLVVSLVFGTLFSETPKLGIVDEGDSQVVTKTKQLASVVVTEYDAADEMRGAVESGALDMGVVLPRDFDVAIAKGEKTEVTVYTWGQSLAKNRLVLRSSILDVARDVAGNEAPISIEAVTIGDEKPVPWSDRLLPLLVLYAVIVAGSILAASALVTEKEKNTLQALVVTPTSMAEIFASKGLLGAIVALVMGIIILVMNQAFGAQPALLVGVLTLGAIMSAQVGLALGAVTRDFTTMMATFKTAGIILVAPAIFYVFPQLPQWIGRMFPTYYLVRPVVEISLNAAGWSEIAGDVYILIALDLLLVAAVGAVMRRVPQYAT